jgi:hypothetical protein
MREPHELVAAELVVLVLVEAIEQPLGARRRRRPVQTPWSAAPFGPTPRPIAIAGPTSRFRATIGVWPSFVAWTAPRVGTSTFRAASTFRSTTVAAVGRKELLHGAADRLPLRLVQIAVAVGVERIENSLPHVGAGPWGAIVRRLSGRRQGQQPRERRRDPTRYYSHRVSPPKGLVSCLLPGRTQGISYANASPVRPGKGDRCSPNRSTRLPMRKPRPRLAVSRIFRAAWVDSAARVCTGAEAIAIHCSRWVGKTASNTTRHNETLLIRGRFFKALLS